MPGLRLSAAWWEVAGRTALAGALGCPGLAFLMLQLLNLRGGVSELRSAAPALAIACCLLAVAWQAAHGRTALAGLLLAAYGIYIAERLIGSGAPLREGKAAGIHLVASLLGLIWIVGRHVEVRRRTLLPVRAAAIGMSAVCLVAMPTAAAEIGRLLGSVLQPSPRLAPLDAGERVPAIRFTTLAGEPVSVREPGIVYVVSFWATWCAPCLLELPELAAAARRAAGDPTVRFLAVNTEELAPERIRAFLYGRGLSDLPACLDPEGTRAMVEVRSLPLTLVLEDGTVTRRFEGYRRGIGGEIEREIARLRRDRGGGSRGSR
jgi:thiol-disulfide isomerase/thioredoxin